MYSWRVPLTLAGELKVAAYADLGGLGTKQGPPVAFVWTMPNLLPLLLPWLVVLALLALPSNRNARAWWIWVPLAALALLGGGLGAAADALDNEAFGYSLQAAFAAAFGLAAVWLLGAGLARCWRVLGIVLTALAFAAVSLLAFVASPLWEQALELSFPGGILAPERRGVCRRAQLDGLDVPQAVQQCPGLVAAPVLPLGHVARGRQPPGLGGGVCIRQPALIGLSSRWAPWFLRS